MVKKAVRVLSVFVLALLCFAFSSCSENQKDASLWESATYKENTEFGSGQKTLFVEVKAEEKSVTFTINTDKETVGEALIENSLIAGEQGAYGIYIKQVNGITADYTNDQSYWAFEKNGEYMLTGVDSTKFNDKEHFELVYTK